MKNEIASFINAAGSVSIPMTNDYLFRAMLQRNNKVLKGLVCSLMHLKEEQIKNVRITNPIILGDTINEKQFFLDINILLNDDIIIDLEMQVINEYNWSERSLSYLCRNFDNLNRGEDYQSLKSAIQIGILNFTLFPEHPEFYSCFQLLNVKNYTKYSDKIRLSVLDLTQISLATEEDKAFRTDQWAALFKAATWEEIKMLAQNNEYINEASDTIYRLTQDEKIRLQCEAREEYYRRERSKKHYMEMQDSIIKERDSIIKEQGSTIKEQDSIIKEQGSTIKEQDSTIKEQDSTIKKQDSTIKKQDSTIKKQDSTIKEQDSTIKEQDSTIKKQAIIIEELKQQLAESQKANEHKSIR